MIALDKKAFLLATTLLSVSGFAVQAQAQTPPAPANQPADDQEASSLDEIIVTAQRRSDNLQRTPIAITALSPEQLENRNVQSTQDLMQVTPGLQVSTQTAGNGGGSATFFVRGMGQQRSGNGTSPAVGIYIDDYYYPSLQGTVFSILDLQQVEVLRGPQGTLFGRNTIGGAIRYTTKKPEFDGVSGNAQATAGSFDRRDVSGSVNLPLGSMAAIRLTGGRLRTDGYVRQQNGAKDAGGTQADLLRGQFRFEPSDRLEFEVSGQYNHNELDGFTYFTPSPIVPIPGTLPFVWNTLPQNAGNQYDSRYASQCTYCEAGTNKREFSDTTYKSGTATATWRLSDALTLKSLTGYQHVESNYLKDLDASPLPINDTVSSGTDRAVSQELQLNGDMFDGRLNWVTGAYYYDEKHVDLFPISGAQLSLGREVPPTLLTGLSKTTAAFVDATAKLTDRLTVLGGYRYSVDDKSAVVRNTAGGVVATADDSFGSSTWRLGAQFQFLPSAMAYATVSRGFRAGGFAKISGTSSVLDTFEPETATNYEVGARVELFDRRVRLNPTLFYTDWSDIQVQRVVAGAGGVQIFVDNAAAAHSQGFELEAEAAVTRNFHLTGNLSLLDIEYDELSTSLPLTDFARAPKVTYSIGADYRVELNASYSLAASMNYSFQDKQFSDPTPRSGLLLPSYSLLNARIELANHEMGWTLAAFATNLTDETYFVGGTNFAVAGTGTTQFDLGRPREYGVTLKYAF